MEAQFTSSDSERLASDETELPSDSEQAPMGDPNRPDEETTERTHDKPVADDVEEAVGPEPERDFVESKPTKPVGGTA